nr:hypothetical protein L203_05785 [Cryptococcus depauperatus CBS 7841]
MNSKLLVMTLVYLHLESVWEGTNTLEQGTIEFWLSTVVGTQIRTMALTLIKEFGTEGELRTDLGRGEIKVLMVTNNREFTDSRQYPHTEYNDSYRLMKAHERTNAPALLYPIKFFSLPRSAFL